MNSNTKMNITNRVEKINEKIGSFVYFPCFLSELLFLNKNVHFCQFCADLSKKCKSVAAIYIYVAESSHYTLSENDMVYGPLSYRS